MDSTTYRVIGELGTKKKSLLVVLLDALLLVACAIQQATKLAHCAICDGIPYHAPCIVNLRVGGFYLRLVLTLTKELAVLRYAERY